MQRLFTSFRRSLLDSHSVDACTADCTFIGDIGPIIILPACQSGHQLYALMSLVLPHVGVHEIVDAGLTRRGYAIRFVSNDHMMDVRAFMMFLGAAETMTAS